MTKNKPDLYQELQVTSSATTVSSSNVARDKNGL
jgi:hypothetical protein